MLQAPTECHMRSELHIYKASLSAQVGANTKMHRLARQTHSRCRPCTTPHGVLDQGLGLRIAGPPRRCRHTCRVAEKSEADIAAALAAAVAPTGAAGAAGLEASIAALAQQAMSADPEAAARMKRYQDAVVRLEKARAAEKELESIMEDALKAAVEEDAAAAATAKARADQLMADAEVAAAERRMQAAALELRGALAQEAALEAAAGRDADRVESGKAAAAAMVGGAAAALPVLLVQSEPGLSGALTLAVSLATCALFGVTYRYAVRDDVGDSHLRGGVVAAFGLVRALGGGDILQATSDLQPFTPEVVGPAALYALQSVVVVGFAAAAMEAALTNGYVKRLRR